MGAEQKTHFKIDQTRCIRCGKCISTCSGMVLQMGSSGYPEMKAFDRFGWRGCWRCQHCLAVCPVGAVSIFDRKPENSLPPPPAEMGTYMEQLIANRRSCRRFLDRDVDPALITEILSAMAGAPTGGNAQGVEYTVIDDREQVQEIRKTAYARMEENAKKHIYTHSFSDFYYGKMKESEKTFAGEIFCSAAPPISLSHMSSVRGNGRRTARSTAILQRPTLNFCAMHTDWVLRS